MQDDNQLLRQFAESRSETAFAELVHRHLSLVFSVASRQVGRDTHLAQDVAQMVFTTLAKKAGQLLDRPTLGGWLYQTTVYAANAVVRSERRRKARELEAVAMNMTEANDQVDWDRVRPLLDSAVAELNDQDRDGVCLRFFESRSFAEIGARLGLTENAARMRVERALAKVHRTMLRRGVRSTSAALAAVLGNQVAPAAPAGLASVIGSAALAAASTSSSVAILAFMKSTQITAAAFAVALLATGAALVENRRANAVQSRLEKYDRERSALEAQGARTAAATSNGAATVGDPANAVGPGTASSPRQGAAGGAQGIEAPKESIESTIDRIAMSSPELQDLYVKQQTIRYPERYGLLYATLKMSPAQIEQFEKILGDHFQAVIDVSVSALKEGLPKNGPAATALLQSDWQQREQQLKALLGESGFREYQWQEQNAAWRSVADTLSKRLYYSESPITTDTALELTRAVATNAGKNGGKIDWPELLTESRQFLAPAQLKALENESEIISTGTKVGTLLKKFGYASAERAP